VAYISRCNCGVHGYDPLPCVEPYPKNKIEPPVIQGPEVLVGYVLEGEVLKLETKSFPIEMRLVLTCHAIGPKGCGATRVERRTPSRGRPEPL
jgi:hypothetical protein